jgi:phospho-N-acetylmuramoyl-pentapeptide-transferase
MRFFLGLILISFALTSAAIVPFINLLYRLKFTRRPQKTRDFLGKRTQIFDRLHRQKAGTPLGAGILLIVLISIFFAAAFFFSKATGVYITSVFPITGELNVIFFTLFSFGLLGFFDDFKKIFNLEEKGVFGLRLRDKFLFQWLLAFIIAFLLYYQLGISIINIPFWGVLDLGLGYIPLAAFIIVAFTNAFNITDGLDGLACGLLLICLVAFCFLSFQIFDTPLTILTSIWIGVLIAFLYFNVYPARVFLGDTGAMAFGALMAVVGLMLGKIIALAFIGGIFILEVGSSLFQMLSKAWRGKKIFRAAPVHLWLQDRGWEEPRIVMRAWLAQLVLAIFGLWLATF